MAENLLVSDMKSVIRSTFLDQITSLELELTGAKGIEAVEDSYTEAKAALKASMSNLAKHLKQIDDCEPEEIREIAQEAGEISEEIGLKLSKFVKCYCRLVYSYVR